MATQQFYEPTARFHHSSFSVRSGVLVRGGRTIDYESGSEDAKIQLANTIERFDPYFEVWCQLNTTGSPHPGLYGIGCASVAEQVYMYGGFSGKRYIGVFSCLNEKTLTWSQLCPEAIAGGPMKKAGCGLVNFHGDKIAVIGGYGIPTGSTQRGSTFTKNTGSRVTDGRGWTNEIHIFDINRSLWSTRPALRGTRPPPCAHFTLTSIDNHRSVFFGGFKPGNCINSDLFIFDFNTMEITKVERCEGKPWPNERSFHAACCLGYGGDDVHLLVTGGRGRDNRVLNDMWLFDVSLRTWKEVKLLNDMLARWGHSVTAISLCQGQEDVNVFGGSHGDFDASRDEKDDPRISETTILTFEQHGSEWVLVGMVDNSKRGSRKRVWKKISESTRAALNGEIQQVEKDLAISQANERRLEERVREERHRAQQAERRAIQAEEMAQDLEAKLKEKSQRIEECEKRRVEKVSLEKHLQKKECRISESKTQASVNQSGYCPSSLTCDSGKLNSNDLKTVLNSTWDARSHWYNVGVNLDISVDTLDTVKRNHQSDCDYCYTSVLAKWLREHPNPTWSALADALRAPSVKMSHIAKQLSISKLTVKQ